jgi:multidrug efflux system membrane fusion protein
LGTVEQIVPAGDPATRSYIVKIGLLNVDRTQIRSGLYGKTRFIIGQRKTFAVPQSAVTQQGQLVGVFVVDQSGAARLRLVKTGRIAGDRIEVLSGLNEGDEIISESTTALRDGNRVREVSKDLQQIASK